MTTDKLTWGETYDISITPQDADGNPVEMDETWQAACRVCKGSRPGGQTFLEPTMTIADGVASCSLDTGDEGWSATAYTYDIRVTDPDGNDYWTETIQLVLEKRNTPAS